MRIDQKKKHLAVTLEQPSALLSWCLHGGGISEGKEIFWAQVESKELTRGVDPLSYLKKRWKDEDLTPDIAFMTSAEINDFVCKKETFKDFEVSVLSTVGMGNALRAGDPGGYHLSLGTINILIEINKTFSSGALIEAISLGTEAKTAAVMDLNISSNMSGEKATGTGTDCMAVASHKGQAPLMYCGKHTKVGELIGKATYEAVFEGIQKWIKRKEKSDEESKNNSRYWWSELG
ncbi:adenosylcobinamide amidohydrolase [Bacteriovoracales bacterium]|nr:adenosylcobinamide amidohydrolase [Bacteriovoracales bacterium]